MVRTNPRCRLIRRGDAPVRTIIASITLRPEEAAYFGDTLGYRHGSHTQDYACPARSSPFYHDCDCEPEAHPSLYDPSTWYGDIEPVRPSIPWM